MAKVTKMMGIVPTSCAISLGAVKVAGGSDNTEFAGAPERAADGDVQSDWQAHATTTPTAGTAGYLGQSQVSAQGEDSVSDTGQSGVAPNVSPGVYAQAPPYGAAQGIAPPPAWGQPGYSAPPVPYGGYGGRPPPGSYGPQAGGPGGGGGRDGGGMSWSNMMPWSGQGEIVLTENSFVK